MAGSNTAIGRHNLEVQVRDTTNDGWRTPMIEDDEHPLNIWRSQQNSGIALDSRFPSQEEIANQQDMRFRPNQNMARRSLSLLQGKPAHEEHLPWRERVQHTSWAWFTMCMATGGLANVLHSIPFRANWLYHLGLFFFFFNIFLFIIVWGMILTRFWDRPSSFRASLVHPTESLFVPAVLVSFGTICITIVQYGADRAGPWLTHIVHVLFWINVVLAMSLSITIYLILWSSLTFTIAQMTPIWIFPAYPLLIIGPHAANISARLSSRPQILAVIVGGFTVQGIGFLVSLTIYSAFVYRLMTQKLPADPSRPGMFVSVGPAAFTCAGTIGMAANLHRAIVSSGDGSPIADTYMDVPAVLAAQILRLVGNWMCLWLWGLAFWFFFVSAISNIAPLYSRQTRIAAIRKAENKQVQQSNSNSSSSSTPYARHIHPNPIPFAMTWYSYVFPQTALTTATFRIADAFDIHALKVLGCVMTGLLITMWMFVFVMMIRAVILKQILWPERGEDREEGGFVRLDVARDVKRRTKVRDEERRSDGAE